MTKENKVKCGVCNKRDYKYKMFTCNNCDLIVCEMCFKSLSNCPKCNYGS